MVGAPLREARSAGVGNEAARPVCDRPGRDHERSAVPADSEFPAEFGAFMSASRGLSSRDPRREATMFARLTTFRIKPDRLEDFRTWRRANETEIYAQPGLRHWIGLVSEDGQAFVVAIFDGVQAACDAAPAARALWNQFADMVDEEPTSRFLEVMAAKGLE